MFFSMAVFAVAMLQHAQPQTLEEHLDALDAELVTVRNMFETGKADQTTMPEPGFLVRSADAPGEDGFHAVTVIALFTGSPADIAGVRIGDRLIMVGSRRLEHEPASVVHGLIKGKTDPLFLLVERKGTVLARVGITVQSRILPCRAEGVRQVGKRWLPGITLLEASASELRRAFVLNPKNPETQQRVVQKLVELNEVLVEFYEAVEDQIVDKTIEVCAVRFQ